MPLSRTASRLNHPNIVPIHAVDDVGDSVLSGIALTGAALGAAVTLVAGFVAADRYHRRSDLVGRRWLWFWKSRFGAWTAKVAGIGLKRLTADPKFEEETPCRSQC